MSGYVRKSAIAVLTGAVILVGSASGASAQTQDGLVNVNVGDVTILEDVRVGVAAAVAANICGVKVGPIAVLGRAVDLTGEELVVCTTGGQPVTIEQN